MYVKKKGTHVDNYYVSLLDSPRIVSDFRVVEFLHRIILIYRTFYKLQISKLHHLNFVVIKRHVSKTNIVLKTKAESHSVDIIHLSLVPIFTFHGSVVLNKVTTHFKLEISVENELRILRNM